MQADLGDRPGDGLQRLVEAVDVRSRRGRLVDSCFQHINILPAALLVALSSRHTATQGE